MKDRNVGILCVNNINKYNTGNKLEQYGKILTLIGHFMNLYYKNGMLLMVIGILAFIIGSKIRIEAIDENVIIGNDALREEFIEAFSEIPEL